AKPCEPRGRIPNPKAPGSSPGGGMWWMQGGGMELLDGADLARQRVPGLRQRAERVARVRGRPPHLTLIAFGTGGPAPHIAKKIQACQAAGVEARPLTLTEGATSDAVIAALD